MQITVLPRGTELYKPKGIIKGSFSLNHWHLSLFWAGVMIVQGTTRSIKHYDCDLHPPRSWLPVKLVLVPNESVFIPVSTKETQ